MYIIKHNYHDKFLKRSDVLDADVVEDFFKAEEFETVDEAKEFLYSTTFFDKGYEIVKADLSMALRHL